MSNLINKSKATSSLLYQEESYQIIGACIAVHKKLGNGFECSVYEEALQKEFIKNDIPFTRYKSLPMYYEGELLENEFIADFVCYDKIMIDVRCVNYLHPETQHQVVNYLKATQLQLALLLNFHESSLVWKRLIKT